MKKKHEKMRLNASDHQSENSIIANRNIYSISSAIRVLRTFHILVEKHAVLNIFNKQDSFAFLF